MKEKKTPKKKTVNSPGEMTGVGLDHLCAPAPRGKEEFSDSLLQERMEVR